MTVEVAGLPLEVRAEAHGRTRLAMRAADVDGELIDACALTIDRVDLHDGVGGWVPVDGIGNVATDPAHRRRGLASALLECAIERMRRRDAAASLLYGIDDFYERFGWRTCGDDRWVHVALDGSGMRGAPDPSYVSRTARASDLLHLATLYERSAGELAGAAMRPVDGRAWARFDPDDALVVEHSDAIVGWAWRGRGQVAERELYAPSIPTAHLFAELHAVDDDAMVAVVTAALESARDDLIEPDRVDLVTAAPEGHALRRLARRDRLGCRLIDEVRPWGGAMLLPFDERGEALASAGGLFQFLPDRF